MFAAYIFSLIFFIQNSFASKSNITYIDIESHTYYIIINHSIKTFILITLSSNKLHYNHMMKPSGARPI